MIEPWQVWLADLDPLEGHEPVGSRPVVVTSSEFALRVNGGRMAGILPITDTFRNLDYRVRVLNPDGGDSYVITEQARTISTRRFLRTQPWWRLDNDEINAVRHALSFMTDLS